MPPLPQIYPHPSPHTSLLPHLLPLLPYPLPLTRRLQYHLSTPHTLILATFPPDSLTAPPTSFAACWVDRSRAPETECWIFSTYELPSSPHHHSAQCRDLNEQCTQAHNPDNPKAEARAQILALLHAIAQAHNPSDRSPLLVVGSVHASLIPLLAGDDPLPAAEGVVSRSPLTAASTIPMSPTNPSTSPAAPTNSIIASLSPSYTKFLIPPSTSPLPQPFLPENYTFSTLHPADLPAVIASTTIPRTEATLAQLGNVCIRNAEGEVVSWGFVGVDGSLSSLYTREGERGRGLGRGLARMLIRGLVTGGEEVGGGRMGFRGIGKGEGWAHADVAVGNEGSVGVMRGVGGREGWEGRWVGVDLGRVVEVVGREFGG